MTSRRITHPFTLPLIHSFANISSLSTIQDHGGTLELERERSEEGIGGEGREKQQHTSMDPISHINWIMVSTRR
jgi:hypothetical protein